ncbi:hypothetical protein D782_4544 [Enterobacteriaceae bacterium strain FGI 57]|jgi:hypothetical protein|nr:hypothetical protein D782_4544 [Enterobacteriaceae bacterium strain FGI 57]
MAGSGAKRPVALRLPGLQGLLPKTRRGPVGRIRRLRRHPAMGTRA